MRHTSLLVAGVSLLALGVSTPVMAGPTLDAIKQRGHIECGVSPGLAGFSNPDDTGTWTGIDVDVCRAAAAAIFGDAEKVTYTPLTSQERFTALQSGEVDVLSRNTTWTLSRDTALGLEFTGVTYYDGQGFMVPTSLNVASATELDGAAVCVQPGTTTELNLADYFRANGMAFTPVIFQNDDEIRVAFTQGRCDVFTTDQSGLYSNRLALPNPDEWEVLPEIISKEPLGPAVRQGDSQWADIMRWSLYAMIEAEELGVSSQNVEEMKNSDNPSIRRLLGVEDKMGENLGVPADWAVQILTQVGNYGESFDRNLGEGSPLKIERGVNALWTDGGLQYAMPVR
ncbi:amino acid ABC transporter substrate-binding protein [Marinivivus vitaminiproducens]|uniref:amino acid ABC transporter substrate-binding protein n=1 Tax=Marinivivus vitaminiproducens TaxID=3035935 RepID=UPI0027A592E9|nr:amino acid ABC transporter substrate-binding protein [Geminicoccaceae bacterium SCSIO 64248]